MKELSELHFLDLSVFVQVLTEAEHMIENFYDPLKKLSKNESYCLMQVEK
jgi:hypothetical protein